MNIFYEVRASMILQNEIIPIKVYRNGEPFSQKLNLIIKNLIKINKQRPHHFKLSLLFLYSKTANMYILLIVIDCALCIAVK